VTEHWRAAVQREAHVAEPPRQATQQEWEQAQVRGDVTYLEAGPRDGVPVVFLHGIGGGARGFLPQLDGLRDACRAVAWDMPGYGGSAPLELVSVDSLTAALAGFLRELELDRPVLIGHSLGGMLVQRLLSVQPDAARAVVLAQTSASFGSKDPAWAEGFIRDRLGPLDAGHGMADLAEGIVAEQAGESPDPDGMALARECFARTPDSTYRDTVLALPGFDLRDALPRIRAPTLVLAGSLDRNAPPAGVRRMADRIPGAQYVELSGAGHLAHLEQPAAFNAAVRTFLNAEVSR